MLSENTPEQIRRKRDLSSAKLAVSRLNSTLPQNDGFGLVLYQIVLENDTVHYRYRLSPSVQESAFTPEKWQEFFQNIRKLDICTSDPSALGAIVSFDIRSTLTLPSGHEIRTTQQAGGCAF